MTRLRSNAPMDFLTSIVRMALGLAAMALGVVVFALICIPLLPWRVARIKVCNVFGHLMGRAVFLITGTTPTGHGRAEMDRLFPAIYVSNHTSPLDIFFGIWLSPIGVCGVAKKEVVYYPFFGQLYWISGHLRVDRQNRERAVEALHQTAELIKKHRLGVWIWPEGTRAADGRLLPFKKGFAHMALATRLPVVPVVVKGSHKVWRKNSMIFHPGEVEVTVLPPIPTGSWTLERLDEHIAEVRDAFIRELPEDQRPLSPPLIAAG